MFLNSLAGLPHWSLSSSLFFIYFFAIVLVQHMVCFCLGTEYTQYSLHNVHLQYPWVMNLTKHAQILKVVQAVLGADVILLDSRFICKYPALKAETIHEGNQSKPDGNDEGDALPYVAWHQDMRFISLLLFIFIVYCCFLCLILRVVFSGIGGLMEGLFSQFGSLLMTLLKKTAPFRSFQVFFVLGFPWKNTVLVSVSYSQINALQAATVPVCCSIAKPYALEICFPLTRRSLKSWCRWRKPCSAL